MGTSSCPVSPLAEASVFRDYFSPSYLNETLTLAR